MTHASWSSVRTIRVIIGWYREDLSKVRVMMTSSNGNIFHFTDLLCGEFTGNRSQRPVTWSFDIFFFISAWTNSWANNGDAGALRPHRAHYDVTVMYLARPGPCVTNVFATRRKNFSQWHRSFQRKLLSHWLKFLRHVAITLVIQGPGHAWAPWGPIKRQTFGWWNFKGNAFNYNVSFWQTFYWNEGL